MKKIIKTLKAGDYVIIVAVICLIVWLFSISYSADTSGNRVEITGVNFKQFYDPVIRRTVEVKGPLGVTRVVIENGEAWVEESPCRDKICIKMGKIRRNGEQAVCIPNRVIIEMVGTNNVIDAVAR